MRTHLLFMVGIVLFVVISILAVIFLKRHFDEQKENLLESIPPLPAGEK